MDVSSLATALPKSKSSGKAHSLWPPELKPFPDFYRIKLSSILAEPS